MIRPPPPMLRFSLHVVVYAASAAMVAPFLWMLLTALKTDREAINADLFTLPSWRWENFPRAWESANLARYYWNSGVVALVATVFGVLHNSLAGFAFAKLRFPARQALFWVAVATMMLPAQASFIFTYLIISTMGYRDTLQALYVPFLASGFGIFYMRQAISTVPDSLIEAGRIDGMSDFEVFWHIVVPSMWAPIGALAIFTFVFSWNNFFWPLIVSDSDATVTLPLAVSHLSSGRYVSSWPVMMAALTIVTLPLVVVYFVFQRAFVRGVSMSGIKE